MYLGSTQIHFAKTLYLYLYLNIFNVLVLLPIYSVAVFAPILIQAVTDY